jgi:hypothetical protein
VDSKLCMYSVDDFTGSRPSWILPIPARYSFLPSLPSSSHLIAAGELLLLPLIRNSSQ